MPESTWTAGFPQRHFDVRRRMLRRAIVIISITGLLSISFTAGSIYGSSPATLAALAWAVFLLFGLFGGIVGVYDTWRHVRIIPYFRRPIGEIDTFLAGKSLARSVTHLDALALEQDVTPLSAFGYNDDLCGEPLTWHAAEQGLRTVDALLDALHDSSESDAQSQAICRDLQKLRTALQRAAQLDVPFCLLLRHGNATSGHEWSIREGSAF